MQSQSGILVSVLALAFAGCQAAAPGGGIGEGDAGQQSTGPGPRTPESGAIVAYVGALPVRTDELQVPLIEAAGGQVMAELVLDRQLDRRLHERGLRVTDELVEAERRRMLTALDPDPDQATRLLAELRLRRGWGPVRFGRLLARNAALRLLVQDEIEISDAAVAQAYDVEYGDRYVLRLIVVDRFAEAAEITRALRAGDPFIALAIERSTDVSRQRGGMLDPISPADPTYPESIRAAMTQLRPGQFSSPIQLENGFAVILLERIIEGGDVPLDDVRENLTRRLRQRRG